MGFSRRSGWGFVEGLPGETPTHSVVGRDTRGPHKRIMRMPFFSIHWVYVAKYAALNPKPPWTII